MTRFKRHFTFSVADHEVSPFVSVPIIARLLAEWQLPGPDAAPTRHGLRLAVRAGSLNFYAKGQSVAKLSTGRSGQLRLEIHRAYLKEADGTLYRRFEGATLHDVSAGQLDNWVERALDHSGEEKRFVDDLVTANPGTIDLEMGLPGDDGAKQEVGGVLKKVAPRMDLVVVQEDSDRLRLAFWEAKCADNGELRARHTSPHVVAQLQQYVKWLHLPGRAAQVKTGYANTVGFLLRLSEIASKPPCAAMRLWERVRDEGVGIIANPGIVIGLYATRELDEARNTLLAAKHKSFMANDHEATLSRELVEGHPITICTYAAPPIAPLDVLKGGLLF